jgi:hypothetical protein
MKTYVLLFLISLYAIKITAQELSIPPNGNNQKAEVSQWIGLVKVTITYHSPDVHDPVGADRKGHIWGELVHFGFTDEGFGPSKSIPWRAGANESTSITFSHDVKISGKEIAKGTYALFLDVEKESDWNWILSSNMGWGSFQYDPKFDVLRIPSTAEEAAYTEWLTYGFDDRQPTSTKAFLQWENKKVSFKIEVPNVNQLYVDQMRSDLQGWAGFTYLNWMNAARFCVQNKINLEEALVWAEKAVAEPFRGLGGAKEQFLTLATKASVLDALGRKEEWEKVLDKAIQMPDATSIDFLTYVRGLVANGKTQKALEVATLNYKKFPDEKFFTYLSLARAYTALGDKKNAIKNWEIVVACKEVPGFMRGRMAGFKSELGKLKGQ